MNRYAKGRRNEWKSKKYLEARGFTCFRTAGSHSDWDIIAIKKAHPLMLVQVKTNKKPPMASPEQLEGIDGSWRVHIHLWLDYAKQPEIYDWRSGGTMISPHLKVGGSK